MHPRELTLSERNIGTESLVAWEDTHLSHLGDLWHGLHGVEHGLLLHLRLHEHVLRWWHQHVLIKVRHVHVIDDVQWPALAVLLLLFILLLSLILLLVYGVDSVGQLARDLYKEWHHVLHQAEPPGQLHGHIRSHQIIAGVQANSEEFLLLLLHEEPHQLLNQLGLPGLLRGLDAILCWFKRAKLCLILF